MGQLYEWADACLFFLGGFFCRTAANCRRARCPSQDPYQVSSCIRILRQMLGLRAALEIAEPQIASVAMYRRPGSTPTTATLAGLHSSIAGVPPSVAAAATASLGPSLFPAGRLLGLNLDVFFLNAPPVPCLPSSNPGDTVTAAAAAASSRSSSSPARCCRFPANAALRAPVSARVAAPPKDLENGIGTLSSGCGS